MIIWKGYGLLAVLFAILGLIIGGLIGAAFETDRVWPITVGLLLAAAANHFTAKKLDSQAKIVIDPETGQQILLKRGDSLFFIPLKYWTYVIAALAVMFLFVTAPS